MLEGVYRCIQIAEPLIYRYQISRTRCPIRLAALGKRVRPSRTVRRGALLEHIDLTTDICLASMRSVRCAHVCLVALRCSQKPVPSTSGVPF